jgi:ATP synthase protein I
MAEKPPAKFDWQNIAILSSLGLMLPSSIAIGLFLGYYLDKLFKTQPWLLIIFLLLGVVSGLFSLIRGIIKYTER